MPPVFSRPQARPEFSDQAIWRFCAMDARVVPTEAVDIVDLPASGAFRTTARKEPAGSPLQPGELRTAERLPFHS